MDTSFINVVIGVIIIVIIFFVFRELFCWYWKINQRIELQEQMLGTMRRILQEIKANGKSQEGSPLPNKPQENRPPDSSPQENKPSLWTSAGQLLSGKKLTVEKPQENKPNSTIIQERLKN